jgi:hypothetical protein
VPLMPVRDFTELHPRFAHATQISPLHLQVEEAAKVANCHSFITAFPQVSATPHFVSDCQHRCVLLSSMRARSHTTDALLCNPVGVRHSGRGEGCAPQRWSEAAHCHRPGAAVPAAGAAARRGGSLFLALSLRRTHRVTGSLRANSCSAYSCQQPFSMWYYCKHLAVRIVSFCCCRRPVRWMQRARGWCRRPWSERQLVAPCLSLHTACQPCRAATR